ncbi:21 kDa protein-like [Iris pallida]|uniref:21 kDa protein-like n=1 Tax=Iris pallida TaxID=29817 RepID=A0AAX6HHK1_IRIPA|nr:21 kDa protein-like [Iris pallida]
MEGYTRFNSLCFVFILVALLSFGGIDQSTCSAARIPTAADTSTEFIRAQCNATDYPQLCVATLSSYAPTIRKSAVRLADVALNVSLRHARSTSAMMSRMSTGSGRMSRKEAEAVSDCIDALGDSVEYLRQSLARIGKAKGKDVRMRINDAQTWVSTALTDESTCMDELVGGAKGGTKTKSAIRSQVVKAAELTSNALALISALSVSSA